MMIGSDMRVLVNAGQFWSIMVNSAWRPPPEARRAPSLLAADRQFDPLLDQLFDQCLTPV